MSLIGMITMISLLSMGYYKDIMVFIDSLMSRGKPFIVIKYGNIFNDIANNAYEMVTIGSNRLRYVPIDRSEALQVIRRYDLPLLHKMDNRNMIWGDEEFKKKYKKVCKGVE